MLPARLRTVIGPAVGDPRPAAGRAGGTLPAVPGRIVLFGATGYTGRLTAEALVERGERPLLAARSAERLERVAAELGGLETAVADVASPESVRALVEPGDVLVTTVGPFARFGRPALDAAVAARASYLDSTGEPHFIRQVFEEYGPQAEAASCGLVTAFGYDFVPGNLAAALALRDAGAAAARVDVGYFFTGASRGSASGGTQASMAGALIEPGFAWRGAVREQRLPRVRTFEVRGRERPALSIGSSEHFALPRLHPGLRAVNVYLGWFGPATRPLQAVAAANGLLTRIPGVKAAEQALAARLVKGSTGGPDAEQRAGSGSEIVAIAYDEAGEPLAEARLAGGNGYDFTGRVLAWGAARAATDGMRATGALGPVTAFGLDELEAGCAEAGLARTAARVDTSATRVESR